MGFGVNVAVKKKNLHFFGRAYLCFGTQLFPP